MTKLLAGALGLSTLVNIFLALTTRNTALAAQKVIKAARENADERVRVAEARYDRLLDRIDTANRVQVGPSTTVAPLPPLSEKKTYISDLPYDDETWDSFKEPTE